jgi:antitoxin FitA
MGQLLVRGLDDRLIRALKERAARHGRSVEAEHRAILQATLGSPTESFAERAARLRARIPPSPLNSTDLIREDRDHDYSWYPNHS